MPEMPSLLSMCNLGNVTYQPSSLMPECLRKRYQLISEVISELKERKRAVTQFDTNQANCVDMKEVPSDIQIDNRYVMQPMTCTRVRKKKSPMRLNRGRFAAYFLNESESQSSCSGKNKGDGGTSTPIVNKPPWEENDVLPLSKVLCNLREAVTVDKKCNESVNALISTQKELQDQIKHLEHREKEGIQMLKQADDLWTTMEEQYKQKLEDSKTRQKELKKKLKDMENDSKKWKMNKKNLELQLKKMNKFQYEIKEKINNKKNDMKAIALEMEDLKKRIEHNRKEIASSKNACNNLKTASDKRTATVNVQIIKVQAILRQEQNKYNQTENTVARNLKEVRANLHRAHNALLCKNLENEELVAEKNALVKEIEQLKKEINSFNEKSKQKEEALAKRIDEISKHLAKCKEQCIQCNENTDTNDIRKTCIDCPRCLKERHCVVENDHCRPTLDCVCMSVKEQFIENVFDNMSSVLKKQITTGSGKAIGEAVYQCLIKSRNGKIDQQTRSMLQQFILTSVKKDLNLTVVGGAVKTRCEMDQKTYDELMLCLKEVKEAPLPKADKKEPSGRLEDKTKCHCPKGPKNCICSTLMPPPPLPQPKTDSTNEPGNEKPMKDGENGTDLEYTCPCGGEIYCCCPNNTKDCLCSAAHRCEPTKELDKEKHIKIEEKKKYLEPTCPCGCEAKCHCPNNTKDCLCFTDHYPKPDKTGNSCQEPICACGGDCRCPNNTTECLCPTAHYPKPNRTGESDKIKQVKIGDKSKYSEPRCRCEGDDICDCSCPKAHYPRPNKTEVLDSEKDIQKEEKGKYLGLSCPCEGEDESDCLCFTAEHPKPDKTEESDKEKHNTTEDKRKYLEPGCPCEGEDESDCLCSTAQHSKPDKTEEFDKEIHIKVQEKKKYLEPSGREEDTPDCYCPYSPYGCLCPTVPDKTKDTDKEIQITVEVKRNHLQVDDTNAKTCSNPKEKTVCEPDCGNCKNETNKPKRLDPCGRSGCRYSNKTRAGYVLTSNVITPSMHSYVEESEMSDIDCESCASHGDSKKDCSCEDIRSQPRQRMVEEVLGRYTEVTPIGSIGNVDEYQNLPKMTDDDCDCSYLPLKYLLTSKATENKIKRFCACSSNYVPTEKQLAFKKKLQKKLSINLICQNIDCESKSSSNSEIETVDFKETLCPKCFHKENKSLLGASNMSPFQNTSIRLKELSSTYSILNPNENNDFNNKKRSDKIKNLLKEVINETNIKNTQYSDIEWFTLGPLGKDVSKNNFKPSYDTTLYEKEFVSDPFKKENDQQDHTVKSASLFLKDKFTTLMENGIQKCKDIKETKNRNKIEKSTIKSELNLKANSSILKSNTTKNSMEDINLQSDNLKNIRRCLRDIGEGTLQKVIKEYNDCKEFKFNPSVGFRGIKNNGRTRSNKTKRTKKLKLCK